MLQKLRQPVILVAQAHRALSVSELKKRRDAQPAASLAHSALAGAYALRAFSPARYITIAVDNIFGTQRLSSNRFAVGGLLGQIINHSTPRLVASRTEPTQDAMTDGSKEDPARGQVAPEDRLPYVPLVGSIIGGYQNLATLPRIIYVIVDKLLHRRATTKKPEAAGSLLSASWPNDGRPPHEPSLKARIKALQCWLTNEEGSDAQTLPPEQLAPALLQQQRMLHIIGFTLQVIISCALSLIPLAVKATLAGVGALLGVSVGLARWAVKGRHQDAEALRASPNDALPQSPLALLAGQTQPTADPYFLAKQIGATTMATLEAHRQSLSDRLPVQPGDLPLLEQARTSLARSFRLWLTPVDPDMELGQPEQSALRYFFTSEEGYPPEVWSDWGRREKRGRILEYFFIQKFDQLEFFTRKQASHDLPAL